MTGNERKKFCDQCACSVHNLTGMKHEQIMDLYSDLGGKLCGAFHQPCQPDTLQIEKKKIHRIHLKRSLVMGASISTLALAACQTEKPTLGVIEPTQPIEREAETKPKDPIKTEILMGKVLQEEVKPVEPPKHPQIMGIVCLPENPRN